MSPTRRPRAYHRINPRLGACRRNETKMFHARGAGTEKALSPIRRRVHGTMSLPHDEAGSVLSYCFFCVFCIFLSFSWTATVAACHFSV